MQVLFKRRVPSNKYDDIDGQTLNFTLKMSNNEELEVDLNIAIKKSFSIASQIYDELNDIDLIQNKFRSAKLDTPISNKRKSFNKKEIGSHDKNISEKDIITKHGMISSKLFTTVTLDVKFTSQTELLRQYKLYKQQQYEKELKEQEMMDQAYSDDAAQQSYLTRVTSALIGGNPKSQ
jgi:hypothetical protein